MSTVSLRMRFDVNKIVIFVVGCVHRLAQEMNRRGAFDNEKEDAIAKNYINRTSLLMKLMNRRQIDRDTIFRKGRSECGEERRTKGAMDSAE